MPQNEAVLDPSTRNLDESLRRSRFDVDQVGAYLDSLDAEARLAAIRSLGKTAQAQLFEAAQGKKQLSLHTLVPAHIAPLAEVPHHGKNSLWVFTRFAKVFCRPQDKTSELWGYNRSGGFVETVVGAGYYVAYERAGEIIIDYTRLPEGKAQGWPEIRSNDLGLSRFVYGGMLDVLRGVSQHVTIGRAIRGGKEADNWFVLCRGLD